MSVKTISRQTLSRLPIYLSYLQSLDGESGADNVSATAIAEALKLNQVQVRKDLAMVSSSGRPKVGYVRSVLIREIKDFLGCDNVNDAVIVGAGRLGRALMGYKGFKAYGLNILAAFDEDEKVWGADEAGRQILPMDKLKEVCTRLGVHIGIITVPVESAQRVCDQLIEAGALAIWNFAPVKLSAPEGVLVQNENMAASLAILSSHLAEKLGEGAKNNEREENV